MSILYTLSCSPYACDLVSLLRVTLPGDNLLLLSDGVTAGIIKSTAIQILNSSPLTLYALKNDIDARGLFIYFSPIIKIINYNDFVKLTEKYQQQVSW